MIVGIKVLEDTINIILGFNINLYFINASPDLSAHIIVLIAAWSTIISFSEGVAAVTLEQ